MDKYFRGVRTKMYIDYGYDRQHYSEVDAGVKPETFLYFRRLETERRSERQAREEATLAAVELAAKRSVVARLFYPWMLP